jgi:putative heme-binding domain-containing protein
MGRGTTDAAGGGHAHAGTLLYLGDSFPPEYRGALFTHNILGNRINQEKLEPSGSGYIGHHAGDFMKANDGWFRGLRLEIGPDGSVFDSDWYDQRACHQQQPHDRTNGRIYKLSYGTPKPVLVDLAKYSNADLVQLLLQERAQLGPDAAVHAALLKILRENPDPTRQLRALWALHVSLGLTESLALELLKSPQAVVRGWTIQLACENKSPTPALLAAFAELAKSDPSPVVRRFLASAAQRIAVAKRWPIVEALLAHGEDASDHNLPLLYWFAAEPLVPADPARALALGNRTPLTALRPYFTRRQAALADDGAKVGANGAAAPLSGLAALVAALNETADPSYQREILDSITAATEGKTAPKAPAGWSAAYAKLAVSPDAQVLAKADALAARFGDRSIRGAKRRIAADTFAPLAARQAALAVVLEEKNFQLTPLYQKLLPEPGLRLGALKGLSAYDVPTTPEAILANYAAFTVEEKRAAVAVLAGRPAYARALLAAVKSGAIPRADLNASLARQLRLFNDAELDQAVTEAWGIVRESPEATAQEIAKWKQILTPERLAAANASRGRATFARTCAVCHVLYGEGAKIGPELTGSNRGELDYILRNVIDPTAEIGRDYQLTTIETNDGRTVAGIVQRETPSAVTIVNQAETVTIARENIKKLERLDVSLMPPGLLSGMPETEVVDLIAYLRTSGQVPLPK